MRKQPTVFYVSLLAILFLVNLPLNAFGNEVTKEQKNAVEPLQEMTWKWGFIDHNGKLVVKPQFDFVEDFSQGLAAFQLVAQPGPHEMTSFDEGKWGFIDYTGKVVTKPLFLGGGPSFGAELIPFRLDEKWGFINRRGKVVTTPQFDWITNLHEGFLSFQLDGNWGFLDRNGKVVITPHFAEVGPFSEGFAAALQGTRL